MKLKDININAQDLVNFLNKHLVFEETQPSEEGIMFELRFFHKIEVCEAIEFISKKCNEQEKQLKNESTSVKPLHSCFLRTHEGIQLGESIMRTHDSVVISGRDFKHIIDKVNKNDKTIPETTPDQRSIHPSSY